MPIAFDHAAFDRGFAEHLAWVRAQYRRPIVVAGTGVVIAACAGMALAAALRPTYPGPRLQPAARMTPATQDDTSAPQLAIIVTPAPQPAASPPPAAEPVLQPASDIAPRGAPTARMIAPAPSEDESARPPALAPAGRDVSAPPPPAPPEHRRRAGNGDSWAPNSVEAQIAAAEADDPQSPPDPRGRSRPSAGDDDQDGGPNRGADDGG